MICTVQDINIYYEIYGEGFPILMIHGWSPDHRLMTGCMEPIFENDNSNWKRIYLDLPGMGQTKAAPWITGADQMLDLVFGFIDTILPNQHFLLVGESFGGYLANAIIRMRSSMVDGLLLICPDAGDIGTTYQLIENDPDFMNTLSAEDRDYFDCEVINAVHNKRVWDRYKEEVVTGLKVADFAFLNQCNMKYIHYTDQLDTPYTKPTLMLVGRQDSVVGYRGLWNKLEMYPRASFVLLDKAAHGLQIDQDVLFTATVKEWLERVECEMN